MVCQGRRCRSRSLTIDPRLPKIKGWIDANNPGDALIPFSVSLEERLSAPSGGDAPEEGASSALGKITQAGYASLDVGRTRSPRTRGLSVGP